MNGCFRHGTLSKEMEDPNLEWKSAVFSQFPSPGLREWAANPLTSSMRETYFGPLIEAVEGRI